MWLYAGGVSLILSDLWFGTVSSDWITCNRIYSGALSEITWPYQDPKGAKKFSWWLCHSLFTGHFDCRVCFVVDGCPTAGLMSYVTGFILKLHIESHEIIDLKISNHYNHLSIVSTQMKFTQKVDYFTMSESFPSTNFCWQKFPPNKIEQFGWLDIRCSIRDTYIRWVAGDGLVGKCYSSK